MYYGCFVFAYHSNGIGLKDKYGINPDFAVVSEMELPKISQKHMIKQENTIGKIEADQVSD